MVDKKKKPTKKEYDEAQERAQKAADTLGGYTRKGVDAITKRRERNKKLLKEMGLD